MTQSFPVRLICPHFRMINHKGFAALSDTKIGFQEADTEQAAQVNPQRVGSLLDRLEHVISGEYHLRSGSNLFKSQ